ncbi:MAG: ABC transporter permease [Clostridia bacterium]|nr:ABC transporter permease subunit [Eubacteriales bacterium]MDD4461529.1 ABC transporter permease subunit [Eubacteriales bacterium]NCC48815.1 ABC transporter permease [Clostridia bacterium]
MKRTMAIFKREFAAYFRAPMGFVVCAIFMAVSGLYFSSGVLSAYINLVGELAFIQSFFFVIIPLMTMRVFSEDRKNGTEVLLYTSPASSLEIVMGKYLAALALFLLMTSGTLVHVIITILYGGLVNINVLGAYVGFVFLGAAYVALGVFTSALTENQIIAAIISFVVMIVLSLLDVVSSMLGSVASTLIDKVNIFGLTDLQIDKAGSAVTAALNWLNPSTRTNNYIQGIFELSPILFFVSFVAVFLFLTNRVIEKRRWSQG